MRLLYATTLAALLTGCDVPEPPAGTGGIELTDAPPGCPRGFMVVSSDYQSSNVSLVSLEGRVLSSSFVSSGSAEVGLSAPLSGDVVPPLAALPGVEVLLLDRYPASVLSWVDLRTAEVRAQLRVSAGLETNPHDYVQVSPNKAYVTRFSKNASDIIILDPSEPKIIGSVALEGALQGAGTQYLPSPDRVVLAGGRLYVLLVGYTADFADSAESRLIAVNVAEDKVAEVLTLRGMYGCSGLALSPDARSVAISCSGKWRGSSDADAEGSGLVLAALAPMREIGRYTAERLGQGSLGFSPAYSSEHSLVLTTFGRLARAGVPAADDTLFELDLESGQVDVVLRSAERAFTIGDVRCSSACAVCFVTDAGRNALWRYDVRDGKLVRARALKVDTQFGLVPRYLGEY